MTTVRTDAMAASQPVGDHNGYTLGRRPALDVVRGVAVLSVLFGHAWVPHTENAGTLGVELFFALSGFLITRLLVEEFNATGRINLRAFYTRRVRRLAPALIAYVGFIALVHEPFRVTWAMIALTLFQVANVAMASGQSFWALGHMWSLSMEEQFYLVWPALLGVLALRGTRKRVLVGLLSVAALCGVWRAVLGLQGAPLSRVMFGPDVRLDALALGCALALGMGYVTRRMSASTIRVVGMAGAATLVALAPVPAAVAPWTLSLAAVASCAVVAWAASVQRLSAPDWLVRPLRWAGKVSYGAYLWHVPVAMQLWTVPWWPVRLGVSVVVAFTIAGLSWRFLERPLQVRRPVSAPIAPPSTILVRGVGIHATRGVRRSL